MRRFLSLLLLAHAALGHAAFAQTIWRGATEYPAASVAGEGLARLAAILEQRTAGQLRLEPRYDGPDGLRSATIPTAVAEGRLEVGDALGGAITALDPIFQLSSLPFLAPTVADGWRLYQAARPAYVRAFAAHGERLLYATPRPASGLWSRAPVTGLVALQDLTLRTYDEAGAQVFRAAGARAVVVPIADTAQRLDDGSVDAVLTSGDTGVGEQLWNDARYFLAIGYAMPLSFTTLSAAAYERLPPEQRRAVDEAAAELDADQWRGLLERVQQTYKAMRLHGVEITEPDAGMAAELALASANVTEAWLRGAGPEAAAVLDAYRR